MTARTQKRTRGATIIDPTPRPSVTQEGKQMLQERIVDLRDRRLAALVPLMIEQERDERIVAQYEDLLAEIADWEAFLAEAVVIAPRGEDSPPVVGLGDRVLISDPDREQEWVRVVDPKEAFLDDERISATSPLGRALIGAKAKTSISVEAPAGTWRCRVLRIDQPVQQARRSA
jgi:transcription elongation GreA/GreB family factor